MISIFGLKSRKVLENVVGMETHPHVAGNGFDGSTGNAHAAEASDQRREAVLAVADLEKIVGTVHRLPLHRSFRPLVRRFNLQSKLFLDICGRVEGELLADRWGVRVEACAFRRPEGASHAGGETCVSSLDPISLQLSLKANGGNLRVMVGVVDSYPLRACTMSRAIYAHFFGKKT